MDGVSEVQEGEDVFGPKLFDERDARLFRAHMGIGMMTSLEKCQKNREMDAMNAKDVRDDSDLPASIHIYCCGMSIKRWIRSRVDCGGC